MSITIIEPSKQLEKKNFVSSKRKRHHTIKKKSHTPCIFSRTTNKLQIIGSLSFRRSRARLINLKLSTVAQSLLIPSVEKKIISPKIRDVYNIKLPRVWKEKKQVFHLERARIILTRRLRFRERQLDRYKFKQNMSEIRQKLRYTLFVKQIAAVVDDHFISEPNLLSMLLFYMLVHLFDLCVLYSHIYILRYL